MSYASVSPHRCFLPYLRAYKTKVLLTPLFLAGRGSSTGSLSRTRWLATPFCRVCRVCEEYNTLRGNNSAAAMGLRQVFPVQTIKTRISTLLLQNGARADRRLCAADSSRLALNQLPLRLPPKCCELATSQSAATRQINLPPNSEDACAAHR